MARRPQNLSPIMTQFIMGLMEKRDWTVSEFCRRAPKTSGLTAKSLRRRIENGLPFLLDDARVLSEFIAEELQQDGRHVWNFLTCNERDPALEEILSVSRHFRPDPKRIAMLTALFDRYERDFEEGLAYTRIMPVCTLPTEVIRLHTVEYARLTGKIRPRDVQGQIKFSIPRRDNYIKNWNRVPRYKVLIFESDYEAAARGYAPFTSVNQSLRYEMVQSQIVDAVRDRGASIRLIRDKDINFPTYLREACSRVDHTLIFGNRLVIKRSASSFDRLWFERSSRNERVSRYIDDELRLMNELEQWVYNDTDAQQIERLKQFLP